MENQTNGTQRQVIVQAPARNGLGTAGFILALVAFFLSWIPVINWILWILGTIFSLIGLTRRPKGLAIAGTIISFIAVIIILIIGASIASIGALF